MTVEDARALVANQALWPRIRDFLWDFAPQVHPSWLEAVPGLAELHLAPEGGMSPRIKRYVLDSIGVERCFHAFPADDWSRLLLLDGVTLESVAKWLGAIACAESLRSVMKGADVRDLKSVLPGVYPEVFGYMPYFSGLGIAAKPAKCAQDVVTVGFSMLFLAFADIPEPVVSRIKFKFPKSLCDFCAPCGKKGGAETVRSAISKLFKLKFPEAYKLCCS